MASQFFSTQNSTRDNQQELAPEIRSACHPSTRVTWGRDQGWPRLSPREDPVETANGGRTGPQHNRLARVARSSNLSFLKPVLEVNTDLATSSVGHCNERGSSLKTEFSSLTGLKTRGYNQENVPGVLLEK